MGLMAQAYKEMRMTPEAIHRANRDRVFDILCANNRPEIWCIDVKCDDTNWGGYCRLHSRGSTCPPPRLNGGWF